MEIGGDSVGRTKADETEKNIAFDNDVLAEVDEWRKRQPGKIPKLKEAINTLLRQALGMPPKSEAPESK